jgi:flagellar motor switch protein FliN
MVPTRHCISLRSSRAPLPFFRPDDLNEYTHKTVWGKKRDKFDQAKVLAGRSSTQASVLRTTVQARRSLRANSADMQNAQSIVLPARRVMPAPLLTSEIIEQARQGASEAAAVWQRAFDQAVEVTPGEPLELLTLVAQDVWNTPGLAIVFSQASGAYVLLVADSSSTLPAWIAAPDDAEKSKLATLGHELGKVLLPEALLPKAVHTVRIDNAQEALLRCQPGASPEGLTLQIRCGELTLAAVLIGCENATQLQAAANSSESTAPPVADVPPVAAAPRTMPVSSRFAQALRPQEFEDGIPALPSYTRSLLKIQVPIIASLASTKLPVGRILEIGPGSIIQFNQSCEQPLSLAIGEHEFAVGEAVKVGEKFGLRITSMVLPTERFWSVKGRRE